MLAIVTSSAGRAVVLCLTLIPLLHQMNSTERSMFSHATGGYPHAVIRVTPGTLCWNYQRLINS